MKGMISKKFSDIDIREAFAYTVLTAFFFWWQKYFPNLSFAYIEKVTLGVRVLYSIVLADLVVSSVKKFLGLLEKKVAAKVEITGSDVAKDEVIRRDALNGETTEDLIGSGTVGQALNYEKTVLVAQSSTLSRMGDLLFYASFSLCFGLQLISSTRFPSIIHLFAGMQRLGVSLSCLIAIFLFNRKPSADMNLLVLQIFILIADIGYLAVHGGIWLYPMMIFVVGAYDRKFLPIVHIALVESLFVIVATFYCSITGFIEMVIKYGKHGYGYAGPNEASMQYLFFLMMYFFARYYAEKKSDQKCIGEAAGSDLNAVDVRQSNQKISGEIAARILNVVDALFLAVGLKFIVSYSSGRASIVCVLALTVGAVIYKLSKLYPMEQWSGIARNIIDKAFLFLFVPIFCYVPVYSFVSAYFFDPEKPYGWIQKIGKVFDTTTLTIRLSLSSQALHNYRPSLFGTFVEESLEKETYFIVDNFYIKNYLQYGLIYFVCTLLILTMINYALWKKKEYFPLFLISIVAGLGFLEAQIGQIQYDIFPLMVFTCDVGWLALMRDDAYNKRLWQKKKNQRKV